MKLTDFANKILRLLGLKLTNIHTQPKASILSFDTNMKRLKSRSIDIQTVIDIGASNGCWSKKVKATYPDASYFLVEANSYHLKDLEDFKKKNHNSNFILAVAGDCNGEIFFDSSDPFGGIASHRKTNSKSDKLPCVTVDNIVLQQNLKGPFLLKLDTHGFEVPIFNGAIKTLEDTNLIIVETYNFKIEDDSLKFWELCFFLEEKGFRPIDLCEPLHRPADYAFWQIDIFFVRKDRKEFLSNKYS